MNTKVRGSITHYTDIELDTPTIRRITRDFIKEHFDLLKYETLTIVDGKLENNYEAVTSHRFDVSDVIRTATENDIFAVKILNELKLNF